MNWLKDKAVWLFGILLAVIGFLVMVLTLGRSRPRKPRDLVVPPRPDLDVVTVPEARVLDTSPADAYEAEKIAPATDIADAIKRLNNRHD